MKHPKINWKSREFQLDFLKKLPHNDFIFYFFNFFLVSWIYFFFVCVTEHCLQSRKLALQSGGKMPCSHKPVHVHPLAQKALMARTLLKFRTSPIFSLSVFLCHFFFLINIFKVCPKEGHIGSWLAEDNSEQLLHTWTVTFSRLAVDIFFSNSFLLKK